MNESELKPCPFCGGEAKESDNGNAGGELWHFIDCSNAKCEIEPHAQAFQRKHAISDWNTRPIEDTLRAQLSEKESMLAACTARCLDLKKDSGEQLALVVAQEREAKEKAEARVKELEANDVIAHLRNQREWSEKTFGPGERTQGLIDHIRKELAEIEADPQDLTEWIDVVILAFDGAWRVGYSPEGIWYALRAKQANNELRSWPDWRTAEPGKAIEHVRAAREKGESR